VTDDTQLAGGAPSDVLITESVAAKLHAHLAEQGRAVGGPQDLAVLLHKAVESAWGTQDAPRFNDQAGGGWTIDLNKWFNGELLYALIRTVHGRRTLTTVVELDEFEEFGKTGQWQSPEAVNPESAIVDADTLAAVAAIEGKQALLAPAQPVSTQQIPVIPLPQESPDDPMLVIVIVEEGVLPSSQDYHRCKRAEVPGVVQGLLAKKGVTENSIEIWSHMTKPKVTIQF
jgi:hypothetical protein